jgi:hypothetical protein
MEMTIVTGSGHRELCRRVRAEYREMPGLILTAAQAQRLWGLEAHQCDQLLSALVTEGFLCATRGGYARPAAR